MIKCRKCGRYSPVVLLREDRLCGRCADEVEPRTKHYVGPERRIRGRNLSGLWRRSDDRPRLGI